MTIKVEDIGTIPNLEWSEYCGAEFSAVNPLEREAMARQAYVLKLVSYAGVPLLVMGAMRHSLLGQPFIWVLLTRAFELTKPGAIRQVVRAANAVIPRGDTAINEGNARAVRLAKAFQFAPTPGTVINGDTLYRIYRRG